MLKLKHVSYLCMIKSTIKINFHKGYRVSTSTEYSEKLNNKLSIGDDEVSTSIIKKYIPVKVDSILYIINNSFKYGLHIHI